jgi:hemoglobin
MSLYERLGGQDGLDAAVDIFYRKVTGGPANYTGKDMRQGHTHLVARGLNDSHVDAVVELLSETLREVGASEEDIKTVVAVCEGARNDVLNRPSVPQLA